MVCIDRRSRLQEARRIHDPRAAFTSRAGAYNLAVTNNATVARDGSQFPAGSTVALSGTARALSGSVNAVFVVDVSGSTSFVDGLDANFDGVVDAADDINSDGSVGDILDVELGAVLTLSELLGANSSNAHVAVVLFGTSSGGMDLSPASFRQSFVDPNADLTGNGVPDVEDAARTAFRAGAQLFRSFSFGTGTNFQNPVNTINNLLSRAPEAAKNQVFFLTDGQASNPSTSTLEQMASFGVEFHGFQITGSGVSNSLQFMADTIDAVAGASGSALVVEDPNELTSTIVGSLAIESVTVNGVPAVLDAAGRFFSPVLIAAGDNVFTVEAIDSAGAVTAQTITLVGQQGALTALEDVTTLGQLTYQATTFNRQTQTLHAATTLTNLSADILAGPVTAAFGPFRPAAVALVGQASSLPGGRPTITFDSEIPPAGLAAGATSAPIALSFSNPNIDRFDFDVSLLAEGNSPPVFSTGPPLSVEVGQPYQYTAAATDSNGDTLTFELTAAPDGVTFDPGTGQLSWTPTVDQTGTHAFELRASDGRGGSAAQAFTVLAFEQPDTAPPAITSSPPRLATVDDLYQYQVTAFDPEGQSLPFAQLAGPSGMTMTADGLVQYTPQAADVGPQPVAIRVTDPAGHAAFQNYDLLVRPLNVAPSVSSTPVVEATVGELYRYDADAEDAHDAVTYSLVSAPTGMNINPRSGIVTWTPTAGDAGEQSITIRATDDRGLFVDQSYTLTVAPDTEAPSVSVLLTSTLLDIGEQVTIQVAASDNVAIATVALEMDGNAITLDANNTATFTPAAPGIVNVVGTATDSSGNVGTSTHSIRVLDPTDTDAPFVEITSPSFGDTVTYLTEIVGTVTDPNLEFYRLEYALAGTNQFTTIAEDTSEVVDGVLGVFDPTILANDSYELRVFAQDVSGNIWIEPLEIGVEGQAKLGNFRLEFTDLQIPLAGIPITINRIYDTLDANQSGDFGFGWQLGLKNAGIRETVRVSDAERAGAPALFGGNPFRAGTRVYLNAPDGRRIGFTFDPVPEAGLLGTIWRPRFVADPGVYATLEVDDITLSQRSDGTFGLYLIGLPYNPHEYTLTTKDGTRYRYDQFDGLLDITDRNNNVLTFTDDGIFSSTGESIQFIRDSQGRITEIIDPAGNSIRYTYDAAGNLIAVTDQVGNTTSMTYLADPAHYLDELIDPLGNLVSRTEYADDGRVASVTDALGNAITQTYDLANNTEVIGDRLGNETTLVFDDRGNIIAETGPLGATFTTTYDENDNQTSVADPNGLVTQFQYDQRGNVTSVIDPAGNEWLSTYTAQNDLATTTDPLGRTTSRIYDTNGNLIEFVDAAGASSTITRDSLGRPASFTDFNGNTTQFQYAAAGADPTLIIHPDGSTREASYNFFGQLASFTSENGDQTSFTHDASGQLLATVDALGNLTTFGYNGDLLVMVTDPLGRVTRFEHDEKGRRVRRINATGGVSQTIFDANDRVIATIDELGRQTTGVFRADGLMQSIIDPLGNAQTFTFDAAGNQTSATDENGNTTFFEYDSLNRLVKRIDAEGNEWTFTYDAVGNRLSSTDPLGNTTTFSYDLLNRPVSTLDALGGVTVTSYDLQGSVTAVTDANGNTTSFVYDERDRLVRETDPLGNSTLTGYDDAGNVISFTDALGNLTALEYDALNRRIKTIDALGGETVNTYDDVGNLIATADPLGRTTTFAFDSLDRRVSVTDPRGSTTAFAYDAVGNRTSVTDPLGNMTQFQFDELNRLIESIDPLGNSTRFVYDPASNLIQRTDRNGREREFQYDALNRLTEERWVDQSTVVRTLEFDYDAVGNLLSAEDDDSQYAFTYDALSRLLTADNTGTPHAPNVVLSYGYDAVGNPLLVADNFGVSVASQYDARNLLTQRIWTGDGIDPASVQFDYNARGERTETRRFADADQNQQISRSTYASDAKGRVDQMAHLDALDAVLAEYDYEFDLADQLARLIVNGEATDYSHDDAGQVTGADHESQTDESYDYDANGNRTGGGQVLGPNNQILSDGEFDYTYDAEGNLLTKTEIATGIVTRYTYDHRNRMTRAQRRSSGGIILSEVEFVYDVFNRRIAKIADPDGEGAQTPVRTNFIYDGDNVWADFNEAGQVVARYLFGDQIDEIIARYRPSEGTAWYLTDHLGSIRDIIDGAGTLINQIQYDSFGNILLETNPAAGDRFKFTGREWDSELELYYYRARFYDPVLGRFVSQDPLGFAGGDANLYRYVGNSPLTSTDPSGNLAVVSYGPLAQHGRRIAGGAAGFAIGYACGYLEAWYTGSDNPHRDALVEAGVGAALGAVAGPVIGALPGRYQLWTGIAIGVYSAATSEDFVVFGIRSTCIAAEFAAGGGFRNLADADLGALGRSIRNFLADESGSLRSPASQFGTLKNFSRKHINKLRNSAGVLEGKNFTRGQRALQKKLGRPGDKFSDQFGIRPGATPSQADVNRIIESIMDSPTASIKAQGTSSLFKQGGFKVRMAGPDSPGVAVDPDGNFLDFLN